MPNIKPNHVSSLASGIVSSFCISMVSILCPQVARVVLTQVCTVHPDPHGAAPADGAGPIVSKRRFRVGWGDARLDLHACAFCAACRRRWQCIAKAIEGPLLRTIGPWLREKVSKCFALGQPNESFPEGEWMDCEDGNAVL